MRGLVLTISIIALIVGLAMTLYGYAIKEVHVISWGLLVVGYTFLALVAAGSSIVNSLYTLFGYKGPDSVLEKTIKYGIWFSLASIIPAWIMILLDLAKPLTGFFIILPSIAIESRIYWMAVLYGVLAILLLLELIYVIRVGVESKTALGLVIVALILLVDVLLASNLGQVYGTIVAVPGWFGAHLAPFFIVSAVLVGVAGQALYILSVKRGEVPIRSAITQLYSWIYLLVMLLYVFLLGWIIITAWYGAAWISWKEVVMGAFALEFWVVEVLLGIVLVLVLAAYAILRRSLIAMVIASTLIFITGFASKYSLIVYHQVVALAPPGLSYVPDLGEILIFIGAVIAWIALLSIGTLILPLEPGEKPRRLWIFR